MVQFHVATRTAQGITAPKKSTRSLPDGWRLVIRLHIATFLSAGLFVSLLLLTGSNYTFILLPVFLSLFITVSRGYRFNTLLNNRPLYFLLTACLALIYYSTVILGELLTHPGSDFAPIILVTTVLAWSRRIVPTQEMLGFPRLQTLLARPTRDQPLIDFVLEQLHDFTGSAWEQEDDVTFLVLQRA